jgi:hypothetical protein
VEQKNLYSPFRFSHYFILEYKSILKKEKYPKISNSITTVQFLIFHTTEIETNIENYLIIIQNIKTK